MSILLDILNGKTPSTSTISVDEVLDVAKHEDDRPLSDSERVIAMKMNFTPSEAKRYASGEKIERKAFDTDPAVYRDEWRKDGELREEAEVERVREEYQQRIAKEAAESAERKAVRAEKNKEWENAAKSKELPPSVKEAKGGTVPDSSEKGPKSGYTVESRLISSHKVPGQNE